jgi:lysozyme family protein
MSNFPDCIKHVLAAEGGLVNHPQDPGGLTKFGISQRSYPALNIRTLSLDDARSIYQRDYWAPLQGDDLPAGLDLMVLDHAVNAGPARAIRLLQQLTNCPADGLMGPITLASLVGLEVEDLIARYADARLDYYRNLDSWQTFGIGWTRRVMRHRRAALAMLRAELEP